jgi:hypothetical protein
MRGRVIGITLTRAAATAVPRAEILGARGATRRRRIVVGLKRLSSFRVEIPTMIARRLKNNTACPKTDSA